jgi:AraC-like DNA-binding protein
VNMKRLLRQKEDWMKRLNSDSLSHPSTAENDNHSNEDEQTVSPKEEEHIAMVNKLKEIINKNIDNPDLSLDILSQEMGTSRSKLYRDIPRIDGLSISDYVHNVRLETAARLLSTTTKTVQEILYDVGFINSSHFTKIFKLKYGITPTDYRKR